MGGTIRLAFSRDGVPVGTIEKHNLIVNSGKYMVAQYLENTDGFGTGITYCSIGTVAGTPVVGGTLLGGEVARKSIVTTSRALNVVSYSTYFPKADSAYNIQEIGYFGHDAGTALGSGQLFEHSAVSFDNSGTAFDLTITYELTIG